MNEWFIVVALAILGVCFGSFVNAAVWRIKVKKDIVHDRSECVRCHHKLSASDLIPVISWLLLRGKCRYCKKPISAQYPTVEVAVMVYFIASYVLWPTDITTLPALIDFGIWLMYGVGLAILFVYDLKWYLLPDRVVWPLVCLSVINFVNRGLARQWTLQQFLFEFLLAVVAIAGVYFALHYFSKGKWVGFGDVKLGLFMGIALGWQSAVVCLLLANVIGCLVIIPGLATGTLKRDSRIPFGPLLIAGFVIAGIWGNSLINWYVGFLHITL